jgi:hypothetical protein
MSNNVDPSHLRFELDNILERFRSDTLITESHELLNELRDALQSEFVEIISQYPHSALQNAVLMTYDESRRLPIHLACDKNAPIEILKCFLDADREKVSIRMPDKWGDLPLHTACSRHQTDGGCLSWFDVFISFKSTISALTVFTFSQLSSYS